MAAAAVGVAHRHNLHVPADISIVGFDDTSLATTVWPELTTIRQPIAAMAESALNLLLSTLRRRNAGETIACEDQVMAHDLIIRESCAPPADARKTSQKPKTR